MLKDKFIKFSDYDFIRLYCALNVKYGQSPLLNHHELEKKLYKFYNVSELKILFEDIHPKKDYINEENSYLVLTTPFQNAQTFGLLNTVNDAGEIRSFISLDDKQANEIIANYNSEIISAMSILFCLLSKKFNNSEIHFNEENLEDVRKYIEESNIVDKDGKVWRMIESSSSLCDVKITEESRKILVKTLLK